MITVGTQESGSDELNRRFQEAEKTKHLDLSCLRLTFELPKQIDSIKYLRSINLYKNLLETVPEELHRFTMLEELNLYRNKLSTLRPGIAVLSNLRILNIGSNRLETVPAPLFELTNLEELDISNNQIKSLPCTISRLTNLRDLKLFRNKLKTVPGEIGNLTRLRKLDLSYNLIVNLPYKFGYLTGLSYLNVSENPLRSPPISIVKRGRVAIMQYLQQDKTDPSKCRVDGSGLKGTIVSLTATFSIFAVNEAGRDRTVGGDNFVVRIVRIGSEAETKPSDQLPPAPTPLDDATTEPSSDKKSTADEKATTNQVGLETEEGGQKGALSSGTDDEKSKAGTDDERTKPSTDDEKTSSEDDREAVSSEKGSKSRKASKSKNNKKSAGASSAPDKKKRSKSRKSHEQKTEPLGNDAPLGSSWDPTVVEAEGEAQSSESEDDRRREITAVQQNKDEFYAAVIDNYNGTYTVSFTPMFEGDYNIQVTLDGVPIAGSPFPLHVDADFRDKAKGLENKVAEEAERRAEAEKTVDDLRDQLKRLEEEHRLCSEKIAQLSQTVEELQKKNEALLAQNEQLVSENESLRKQIIAHASSHKSRKSDRTNGSSSENTNELEEFESPRKIKGRSSKRESVSIPKSVAAAATKKEKRKSTLLDSAQITQAIDSNSATDKANDDRRSYSRSNSQPLPREKGKVEKPPTSSSHGNLIEKSSGEVESKSTPFKEKLAFWKIFSKDDKRDKDSKSKDVKKKPPPQKQKEAPVEQPSNDEPHKDEKHERSKKRLEKSAKGVNSEEESQHSTSEAQDAKSSKKEGAKSRSK